MHAARTADNTMRTTRRRPSRRNGRFGAALLVGISALALLGGSAMAQVDDTTQPTPPAIDATAGPTTTVADETTQPAQATPPAESGPVVRVPEEGTPPDGVTITVNGLPFPEGGSRIASCVFQIDVNGLSTDEHQLRVLIEAVSPTVPEESAQVVYDETTTATGPSWWNDITMNQLVAPFERKPNGYHLALSIQIDGQSAGTHTYWLGCDEAQTGKPTRVQFAIQWVRVDGSDLLSPYDPTLPDGWRVPLALDAESDRGTATCTYPDGSDDLACEYDNPGHGSEKPGLVVPGNPRATYDVSLAGVPSGWELDTATVGTFVGRETCPRGGGHDQPAAAPGDPGPGQEEAPCFHVVVLHELPVPPTTTTSTTAAVAPVSTTPPAATVAAATTGTLPATGAHTGTLLAIGFGLIGLGLAALIGRRRLGHAAG